MLSYNNEMQSTNISRLLHMYTIADPMAWQVNQKTVITYYMQICTTKGSLKIKHLYCHTWIPVKVWEIKMLCNFIESLVHHFNNVLTYIDKDIIDVRKS
jgi:hypothetical protein